MCHFFRTLGFVPLPVTMCHMGAGELLQAEMKERGLTKRGLARLLANGDDERIEYWRRTIYRYLDGGEPNDDVATEMERLLGKPAGHFPRRGHPESGGDLRSRLAAAEALVADLTATVESMDSTLGELVDRVGALERRPAAPRRSGGSTGGSPK